MPNWLADGLELCRQHVADSENEAQILEAAKTLGWVEFEQGGVDNRLIKTNVLQADAGRYLYHVRLVTMQYGQETIRKCQLVQNPEPFGDPLPEAEFSLVGDLSGVDGDFVVMKACDTCPNALLGQWTWNAGARRVLLSGQADASTTISFLVTTS